MSDVFVAADLTLADVGAVPLGTHAPAWPS
jgi:hypothetical protein